LAVDVGLKVIVGRHSFNCLDIACKKRLIELVYRL